MPGQQKKKAGGNAPIKAVDKPTYGLGLANRPQELELPSGAICLATRPGAEGLIKAGLLDSVDQLTALVQRDQIEAKDPRAQMKAAAKAMAIDTKQLMDGLVLINKAVSFVVKEPRVFVEEIRDSAERGKSVVYTFFAEGKWQEVSEMPPGMIAADDVDLEDKMFIFQWCVGGTADLTRFRRESAELMGGLSAGEDV